MNLLEQLSDDLEENTPEYILVLDEMLCQLELLEGMKFILAGEHSDEDKFTATKEIVQSLLETELYFTLSEDFYNNVPKIDTAIFNTKQAMSREVIK